MSVSFHFGEHNDHFMLRRTPQITRPEKTPTRKHIRKTRSSFETRKRMENMTWTRTETIRKHVRCRLLIWLRYPFITQRSIPHLWLRRSKETACFGDAACESHLQSDRSKLPVAMKDSDFFSFFSASNYRRQKLFAQVNLNYIRSSFPDSSHRQM